MDLYGHKYSAKYKFYTVVTNLLFYGITQNSELYAQMHYQAIIT